MPYVGHIEEHDLLLRFSYGILTTLDLRKRQYEQIGFT